ncbi:hypothetical protein F5146DRAFT_1223182 [Armillaria mellea]|nr:hypothetical protein F5146DRAFT_1223182 [Armillaria mellea]
MVREDMDNSEYVYVIYQRLSFGCAHDYNYLLRVTTFESLQLSWTMDADGDDDRLEAKSGDDDDDDEEEGGKREDLRLEEWKVDVPTIGQLCHWTSKVVCHFSGLGRPLSLKAGDFKSNRCWFNRAWTLQEVTDKPIIGGETGDNVVMEDTVRVRFHRRLEWLQKMKEYNRMFHFLSEMRKRESTKPLDKSEEEAWTAIVNAMETDKRAYLLFFYPAPGDGNICWRTTWKHVMTKTLPSPSSFSGVENMLVHEADADLYRGSCIDSAEVRGFAFGSKDRTPPQGELAIRDRARVLHKIRIVADHAYPIPDGPYVLIGAKASWHRLSEDREDLDTKHWIIGRRRKDTKFVKFSVFKIPDVEE